MFSWPNEEMGACHCLVMAVASAVLGRAGARRVSGPWPPRGVWESGSRDGSPGTPSATVAYQPWPTHSHHRGPPVGILLAPRKLGVGHPQVHGSRTRTAFSTHGRASWLSAPRLKVPFCEGMRPGNQSLSCNVSPEEGFLTPALQRKVGTRHGPSCLGTAASAQHSQQTSPPFGI